MTVDRGIVDPVAGQSLEALCRKHRVLRLSLFGSGATGNLGEESDLDFMVEFEELSPSEHADAYFGLLADLETLFRRRIDLLEKSAIENPYLLRGIERSRRLLYEAA
jgi:uncharacterized protein